MQIIKKPVYVALVIPKLEPKSLVVIPTNIVGKQAKFKSLGVGAITAIKGTSIEVVFENGLCA